MNLNESPEDKTFRQEVREFVAANLPSDISGRVLAFKHPSKDDSCRWQKILAERGWGAPGWPKQFGGCGWNASQKNTFEEEVYKAGAPRQMPFGLAMVGPVIQKFGTVQQQDYFLPRIIRQDDNWCQGYSEPGAGSDLASLKTRAERDGDDYLVNGQKIWTSFAHWANWIFCLVRTNSEGRQQEGISFLLIDMASPGITVRPIKTLDGGVDVNEVFFDNVRVPVSNLVGEENKGWTIAKFLLGNERTSIAGVGSCKRFLTQLKEIAGKTLKHGKPMLEDRVFREKIVRVEMELHAHDWSLQRLLSQLASNSRGVGIEPSILKIRGSEIQQTLTELMMECAGPYAVPFVPHAMDGGFDGETANGELLNAMAPHYLDYRKISIYGGSNEVQRNIIAKMTIGL
ncbi:pimeloyl-CoA dehydrogenase large subunit [Pseudomonas cavernae]|uniref:Pimeloyl-CoA dehydrogenase large subunit n=1 Tax=Pseudomonas cavernae TaxID=2320867 RepID=A0A385YZZ7_9PSED|nr:acyl-CoA dehydrogenase family protein [Pseudomonas cavernae]AYC31547.1 pimeloyl-CoA dehydrogenase large subunit [Pseudomonas cavernae]